MDLFSYGEINLRDRERSVIGGRSSVQSVSLNNKV